METWNIVDACMPVMSDSVIQIAPYHISDSIGEICPSDKSDSVKKEFALVTILMVY